jgi:hypothetical protein
MSCDGDCFLKAILQHKVNSEGQQMSSSLASHSLPDSLEVDCVSGVVANHSIICGSGEILTLFCNGSSTLRGRQSCPTRSTNVTCQAVTHQSSVSSQNITCQLSLSESSESVSVCRCGLSGVGPSGPVSFSIWSVQKSVLTNFVSTWETVPSLSSGDLSQSKKILLPLGAFLVVFLLLILVALYVDFHNKHDPAISPSEDLVPPTPGGIKDLVDDMEEKLLPFTYNSLWSKFKADMRVHHRWLGILPYSPEISHSLRALLLFSINVSSIFSLALLFGLTSSDDGSCKAQKNELACLSLRSTLNLDTSRCYWQTDSFPSSGDVEFGSCHYRPVDKNIVLMIMTGALALVTVTPHSIFVEHLIKNVLSRRTLNEEERKRLRTKAPINLQSQQQREVMNSQERTRASRGRLGDDCNKLLSEVSTHYESLSRRSEKDAEEFICE